LILSIQKPRDSSTGLILAWQRLPHAGGGVILACQVQ
jgi:hypothetical protein